MSPEVAALELSKVWQDYLQFKLDTTSGISALMLDAKRLEGLLHEALALLERLEDAAEEADLG